ncbi:Branched-chain amino acid transport system permease protein LivM [Paramagnetospirillum magnetotacticum MS-1]|uniref:Branched-chain amino acid transport system permease protein LivM n=1 Tax=Paramagnetospirillum magnetotacticum MS-1 TaxID=272627 RepID=A0A0C2V1B0_PARME|nr:branched-chain amino acid ABC transporter permease [Paramagnetospirillum magnetotacticum]KIL98866.1 Branched-chain amino acid transport system permease protein LivM [Paramagnetospirillum magnetotacticum MS-1]
MSRQAILLGLLLAAFALAPLAAGPYLLSVLVVVMYFAYVGQTWNIMMGFAGQLSLGHTLYVGLGAYTAAALFVHLGVPAALGLFAAVGAAVLTGGIVGALGFRFGVKGVYFALLTIAFAEFTRILFEHIPGLGGPGGLFLPVGDRNGIDLIHLRGHPLMFYYLILAMTVGIFLLCRWLLRSRLGYTWLAVREDQEAAAALGINVFRAKLYAVMLSAGLTALGGVFFAFYYNNLFPNQAFGMNRSIEIILAPIVGGLGTLFGPILGALILTPLGEGITLATEAMGFKAAGIKQLCYGLSLLAIVKFLPDGVWPWARARLGLEPDLDGEGDN